MQCDAVGSCLNNLIEPKGVSGIVVTHNESPCTHKELPGNVIGNVLTFIDHESIPGRSMHLSGIIDRKEFQNAAITPGVGVLCLIPPGILPKTLHLHDLLKISDCSPLQVGHRLRHYRVDACRFPLVDLLNQGKDKGLQDRICLAGSCATTR